MEIVLNVWVTLKTQRIIIVKMLLRFLKNLNEMTNLLEWSVLIIEDVLCKRLLESR